MFNHWETFFSRCSTLRPAPAAEAGTLRTTPRGVKAFLNPLPTSGACITIPVAQSETTVSTSFVFLEVSPVLLMVAGKSSESTQEILKDISQGAIYGAIR